jgi:DNA-binding transcriptional ArsR family regulator
MVKKEQYVCDVRSVDDKKVRTLKRQMISNDEAFSLSETFSVLADPTRSKIIHLLLKEELCVCDIAGILGMSVSAVSHQLRTLRTMRIVKFRKESKMVHYSLDDDHIRSLFNAGLKHVKE